MRLVALLGLAVALSSCSRGSFDHVFARGDRSLTAHRYAEAVIDFSKAVRMNPSSSSAQMKLGDAYIALQQPARAAAAYESACSIDNHNVPACVAAAGAYLSVGDFEHSAGYARIALAADRLNLDAQLILGAALIGSRRFADAEERLAAAIALVPDDPRPYRALAELQRRRGDDKAAEALLRKAIALDPKGAASRVSLAELYLERGRKSEGERELQTALADNPDDLAANRTYATYLVDSDRCTDAEPYWKNVAARTPDGSGALALADYYVWSGRPDDALRVLEPLADSADDGGEARTRMAAILYDRGERNKAADILKHTLTTDRASVNGLVLQARMALDRGDVAEAREYAHRAAAIAPDAPAVRQALAATAAP